MGIFNRNEERLDLIQKTQNNLDLSQKNTEIVLSTLSHLSNNHYKEEIIDDTRMRQAAYALNLCSVSVSQIIDYNDIYILEQEYEMILNNLNIEIMPKDEALLNILKQILDTITFFKIQEGDKKFIEKEYQNKMKAAIWSAVPNIGAVISVGVSGFSPISLVSLVGTSYMNYRKEKANGNLELDRQMWQLQRSAIEQFNGLRRELFDTAWRLADKYQFPDNYRLTEKQITQYNEILMETHPIKKYERLLTIKDKFEAYPSFMYQIGNAANDIYRCNRYDDSIKEKFKSLAKTYFDEYFNINKYDLLRENHIASSCALEYIGLLDYKNDKNKIEKLLRYAIKSSGDANDVLELCAIEYLKLGNTVEVGTILKRLVNEDYNTIINSQILSNIYVFEYIKTHSANVKDEYKLLCDIVNPNYLFPMPDKDYENYEDLNQYFLRFQKRILIEKYLHVLSEFVDVYTINFNKVIPMPETKQCCNYMFSDDKESREIRMNTISKTLKGRNAIEYIDTLKRVDIEIEFLNVLNRMFYDLIKLKSICNSAEIAKEQLKKTYMEFKDDLNEYRENIENTYNIDYDKVIAVLNKYTFKKFTEDFFDQISKNLNTYIYRLNSMDDLMNAEGTLRKFCIEQNITWPEILYNQNEVGNLERENFIFIEANKDLKKLKKEKEILTKMDERIKERIGDFDNESFKYISQSMNTNKLLNSTTIEPSKFIGYLDKKSWNNDNYIYFTTEKIYLIQYNREVSSAYYSDIKYDKEKNMLYVNENQTDSRAGVDAIVYKLGEVIKKTRTSAYFEYKEKGDITSKLYDLIKELNKINPNAELSCKNNDDLYENKLRFRIEDRGLAIVKSFD